MEDLQKFPGPKKPCVTILLDNPVFLVNFIPETMTQGSPSRTTMVTSPWN